MRCASRHGQRAILDPVAIGVGVYGLDPQLRPQSDPSFRYHLAAALAKSGNLPDAKATLDALEADGLEFPERPQALVLKQQVELLL